MQIKIEPTGIIEQVNGIPCRLWQGVTDKGVAIKAWVATVQPQTHDEAALSEFNRELREVKGERRLTSFDIRLAI